MLNSDSNTQGTRVHADFHDKAEAETDAAWVQTAEVNSLCVSGTDEEEKKNMEHYIIY